MKHDAPIGTVAPYGPDTSRATKIVAAVLRGEDDDDRVIAMRTWTSDDADLRHDGATRADILAFFAMHGVREIGRSEKVIGCPHQEGIDYPMGRACPQCPFWSTIDRFTHEPIRPPVATMTAEEVLERLASDPVIVPKRVLASADALQSVLVDPLVQALERAVDAPADLSEEEASLFSYALYLLAKWRETRAYPLVIRWLSLPGEEPFALGGDIVTQDAPRILAAVCDGNLAPIYALAADSSCNEYCRGAAVDALALLAAWAEIPRAAAIDELTRLERHLERAPSQAWSSFAVVVADHAIQELLPAVQRAYDDGLVDATTMEQSELDAVPWTDPERALKRVRERWPPIDDVAQATSWWDRSRRYDGDPADTPGPAEKVGRNDPCPCGSGKKFKKCCGG